MTAVQSCNISLKVRESRPPFSSTPCRGQSADGLLGIRLIWEHLTSWSMSFVNFRERFLTRKKKKLQCSVFRAVFSKLLINVRSELEKIPCDWHHFLLLVFENSETLLSKLWNRSIVFLVVRFNDNHYFRMWFFPLKNFIYT